MSFGDEQMPLEDPWAIERIVLAERFGWTFEVINRLPLSELNAIRGLLNARAKLHEEKQG